MTKKQMILVAGKNRMMKMINLMMTFVKIRLDNR